jgi:hypothetical protein
MSHDGIDGDGPRVVARDVDSGRHRCVGSPDGARRPNRLVGSSGAAGPRLSDGRESGPSTAAGSAATAVHRCRSVTTGGPGASAGTASLASDRHHRDTRHDFTVASAAHRAEVDVPKQALRPSRGAGLDSPPGRSDGGRESHLGLHADPRRPQVCRASRWTLDDRPLRTIKYMADGALAELSPCSMRCTPKMVGHRFRQNGC